MPRFHRLARRLSRRLDFKGRYRLTEFVRVKFASSADELVEDYDDTIRLKLRLNSHLQSRLFYYGQVDDLDLKVLRNMLGEGMVVVDVGANIGAFALVAAKRVGQSGKVIAFEPFQKARLRLEENIGLNRFANLEVHPVALGLSPGTANSLVREGLEKISEKFVSPEHIGPGFLADFEEETDPEERQLLRRDAFELVNSFFKKLGMISDDAGENSGE